MFRAKRMITEEQAVEQAEKLLKKLDEEAKKLIDQVKARAGQDNKERQQLVYPQEATLADPPNTNWIGTLTTTKPDDDQGE